MADWVDFLCDAVSRVTDLFLDGERPRRTLGVICAGLMVFGLLGTAIALSLGVPMDPVGFYVLVPMLLLVAVVAGYCLVTDRSGAERS